MDLKDHDIVGHDYWWFRGKRDLVSRILPKVSNKNFKILNIGCGVGEDIETLRNFGNVYSIDISSKLMPFLDGKIKERFSIMDAQFLGFRNSSFDLVVILDVLEHIKNDRKAITEIHRILKENGYLLASVPAFPVLFGPMDVYEHHHRRYSKKNLIKLVGNLFRVEKITYWNSFLFLPSAAMKLFKKHINPDRIKSDFRNMPGFVNSLFFSILKIENMLIEKGIYLPAGTSLILLGKKSDKGDNYIST